jgi:PAS domain S-box-containing protein
METLLPSVVSLRQRAEAFLGKDPSALSTVTLTEIQTLVHELEVHQVELEIRNEELRRAQVELAQSRDRYAVLYEFAPIAYVTLDRDDTILEANFAAARMLGVECNQLVGRRKLSQFVTRESQDAWHICRRDLFERRETGIHELTLQTGSEKPLMVRIQGTVLQGVPDDFPQVALAMSDITEQKWAEKALREAREQLKQRYEERTADLRESEVRFRTLTEQSPNMILIGHARQLLYVNPMCERMLGYARKELCTPGFDFFTLLTPQGVDTIRDRFAGETREKQPGRCEVTLVGKKGNRIDVILSSTPVEFGRRPAVLAVLTDITARKRAETERAQYQERLRHLTTQLVAAQEAEQQRIAEGLHDEVAQLLVACTVKLALMRRAADPNQAEQLGNELDALLGQADEKLRNLMFDLATPTLRRLGLKEALAELCESMQRRYGVRFRFEDDGQAKPLSKATANVFFKVGRELVFNVVKHAGVDQATMYLGRVGSEVKMTVEDQGIGFKNPRVGQDPLSGQGLGLFWACERLRDIGGTMKVESEPGVLTRVSVQAPFDDGPTSLDG